MKRKLLVSTLLATLLATNATAEYHDKSFMGLLMYSYDGTSVGGQAGLFGLGLNFQGKFSKTIGLKVGFDTYTYNDYEIVDDQVKYNFDVETQDFLATVDWHPYAGSFKTSAGVIINNSNLVGTITPTTSTSFVFNNVTYSTDDIAKVDTSAEFDPVAPYLGIGWDTSWTKKNGFGFTFDLGVIYQGSASVDYTVKYKAVPKTGNPAVDAAATNARETLINEIDSNLAAEKKSLQTELDKYEFLPYIAIGVNYKF